MEVAGRRYDLIQPIASGGMGDVFLGRVHGEHGFHKMVAIKRVRPELVRHPEFVVRFVAEAKLAVSLSHANVVQVFDLGRAGDELLLVMEYVQGVDLGQLFARLSARGLAAPVEHVVYVACEALKGLAYAHEHSDGAASRGVIHCDVSPSNLLVSFAGEVKLTDFGVAQALDAARRRRRGGQVMGKARYLAPEQLSGEALDARTDLYALAVVMHEALTLRRPFDAPDADHVAARVLAGELDPVSSLRPDVPAALSDLVRRAVSRKPADRPTSARVMLAELTQLARTLSPVTAPEVGTWASTLCDRAAPTDEHPRTATLSATHTPPATVTFVARQSESGVTLLERLPPNPRRAGWPAKIAVATSATVLAAFLLLRPASAPMPVPQPVPVPVAASQPAPVPVAEPQPAPAPVPVSVSANAVNANANANAKPSHAPRVARTVPPAARSVPGFLNIYAEPWAHITVDGHAIGTTPLAKIELPIGEHRVRFDNPRARPAERVVHIVAGQTQLLDVDLDLVTP